MEYVIDHFYDPTEKFFFYTSDQAEKLINRKKEIFDNVIPSSNSVMARNLYQLGSLLDHSDWKLLAHEMMSRIQLTIEKEPVYLSYWGIVMQELIHELSEVVIVGKDVQPLRASVQETFSPFAIFCGTESISKLPLIEGRNAKDDKTWIYVCRNKTCQLPVQQAIDALKQVHRN
jgi:uncharacterized protein YyaL (SSP411 family)